MNILQNISSAFIYNSKKSEIVDSSLGVLEFRDLVNTIAKKYGLLIYSNGLTSYRLLFTGSSFIFSSKYEKLLAANTFIDIELSYNGQVKITSQEKLISPLASERKNFDRVIETRLIIFMSFLNTELKSQTN
ncbi:hypothetical protein [Flammeovirga kamogawensis]|uniref:Uncharacterized protein n=1 Tax=Flammeovirga kamogawensis TaxID=373891 RepID=A0ABX8GZC0_9BACT|nr:hypothetical protein [Flammeovirga kamogawensis]MBB6459198.1 hypothetical protein [Flammeovirga kamogawensis]QWG08763.1 hypothetical protein KM029_07430 [Flammeovirga kamogawensis]TRX67055.1 hypothetical protein EO216_02475 [Flammeovirga kamogawensis]